MPPPLLQRKGFLLVHDPSSSKWIEKHFFLCGQFLRHRRKKSGALRPARSLKAAASEFEELSLRAASVNVLPDDASGRSSYSFQVTDPQANTTWTLAAPSAKERALWVAAIQKAVGTAEDETQASYERLRELACRMAAAIEVRDRQWHLQTYHRCFVGEDAVGWLVSDGGCANTAEAMQVGRQLVLAGLVYHVSYEHSLEDSYLFYRFAATVSPTPGSAASAPATPQRLPRHAASSSPSEQLQPPLEAETADAAALSGMPPRAAHSSGLARGEELEERGKSEGFELETMVMRLSSDLEGLRLSLDMAEQRQAASERAAAAVAIRAERALQTSHDGMAVVLAAALAALLSSLYCISAPLAAPLPQLHFTPLEDHAGLCFPSHQAYMEGLGGASNAWQDLSSSRIRGLLPIFAVLLSLGSFALGLLRYRHVRKLLLKSATNGGGSSGAARAAAAAAAAAAIGAPRVPLPASVESENAEIAAPSRAGEDGGLGGDGAGLLDPAKVVSDLEDRGNAALMLPPVVEWPQTPLFVRLSPNVPNQVRLDNAPNFSHIVFNDEEAVLPFETDLFRGRLILRVAGLQSSSEYFAGRQRLWQCAVQGEFKREMRFDKVVTGQSFARELRLPAKWLLRSAAAVAQRLSPSLRADIAGRTPYMLSSLASTAQAIRVEERGEETEIGGGGGAADVREDTAFLGAGFARGTVPASARKRFFARAAHQEAFAYTPDYVYTFDFYQHLLSLTTFEVDLGFKRLRLADYLNGQPLSVMAQDLDSGQYLWNIEMWHSSLLER